MKSINNCLANSVIPQNFGLQLPWCVQSKMTDPDKKGIKLLYALKIHSPVKGKCGSQDEISEKLSENFQICCWELELSTVYFLETIVKEREKKEAPNSPKLQRL